MVDALAAFGCLASLGCPAPQLRASQRLYMCQGKHLRMRLRRINRLKAALITAKQRHLIVVEKREAVKRDSRAKRDSRRPREP